MLRHCLPSPLRISALMLMLATLHSIGVPLHAQQLSVTQNTALHPQASRASDEQWQQAQAHSQQRRQWVDTTLATTQSSTEQTLQRLAAVASDQQLSPIERDLTLQQYTMSLRQLQPEQVSPEVLRWLEQYQHQSWRTHEESQQLRLPAANVQAALMGTRNEWQFNAGQALAWELMNTPPTRQQLARYQRGGHSFQRGLESQLNHLVKSSGGSSQSLHRFEQLWQLSRQQQGGLSARLTGLLALTLDQASDATQLPRFREWLQAGGQHSHQILRQHAASVSASTWFELSFLLAKQQHSTLFANTLAVAMPRWHELDIDTQKQYQQQLYQQLSNAQNGSVAALHLATITHPETLLEWQQQAADTNASTLLKQRLALIAQQQTYANHSLPGVVR